MKNCVYIVNTHSQKIKRLSKKWNFQFFKGKERGTIFCSSEHSGNHTYDLGWSKKAPIVHAIVRQEQNLYMAMVFHFVI